MFVAGQQRGRRRLRQRRRLHREVRRGAAPHRDPARRRRAGDGRSTSASASARSSAATRSCSKRRPRPIVDPDLRARMGEAAIAGALAVNYAGAGTVEFLVDKHRQLLLHGDEHADPGRAPRHGGGDRHRPDRVPAPTWRMARSSPARDAVIEGHAIECRINAEDPFRNFSPSPGTITGLHTPKGHGVRVRHPRLRRLHRPAVLRLDDRQAHRARQDARAGDPQDAPRPRRVHHRGHQDDRSRSTSSSWTIPRFQAGDFDTGFLNSFTLQPQAD